MANKRPGTDWSKVSFPPKGSAMNTYRDIDLIEDEEEVHFGKHGKGARGATGGSGRKLQPPELGPIHRKGNRIFQTIIVSQIKIGGQTGRETPSRRRIDLDVDKLHKIITAYEEKGKKPPHGLKIAQVHEIFQTLCQRRVAVEDNTRAVADGAATARYRREWGEQTGVRENPLKAAKLDKAAPAPPKKSKRKRMKKQELACA